MLTALCFYLCGPGCWQQHEVMDGGALHTHFSLDAAKTPRVISLLQQLVQTTTSPDPVALNADVAATPLAAAHCSRCLTRHALAAVRETTSSAEVLLLCPPCAHVAYQRDPTAEQDIRLHALPGSRPFLSCLLNLLVHLCDTSSGTWRHLPSGVSLPSVCLTTQVPQTTSFPQTPSIPEADMLAALRVPCALVEDELQQLLKSADALCPRSAWSAALEGRFYMQFTLGLFPTPGAVPAPLRSLSRKLRDAFPCLQLSSAPDASTDEGQGCSTAVLIGAAGCGTGAHVDRANAVNIAVAIGRGGASGRAKRGGSSGSEPASGSGAKRSKLAGKATASGAGAGAAAAACGAPDSAASCLTAPARYGRPAQGKLPGMSRDVLAIWLFWPPLDQAFVEVNAAMQRCASIRKLYPNGVGPSTDPETRAFPALSVNEILFIAEQTPTHTRVVWQHHGDAVTVPVGWSHFVANAQPCIKVAFDRLICGNLAKAALSHRLIASPRYGAHAVKDYMELVPGLARELYDMDRTPQTA